METLSLIISNAKIVSQIDFEKHSRDIATLILVTNFIDDQSCKEAVNQFITNFAKADKDGVICRLIGNLVQYLSKNGQESLFYSGN